MSQSFDHVAFGALLDRYPPGIPALARQVVGTLRDIGPDLAAKVQTGWGSVNFTHKRAGFLVAVFPGPDHVSVIFQKGKMLSSPLLVDNGKVKQVRWIPPRPGDAVPTDEIAILIAEAIALAG